MAHEPRHPLPTSPHHRVVVAKQRTGSPRLSIANVETQQTSTLPPFSKTLDDKLFKLGCWSSVTGRQNAAEVGTTNNRTALSVSPHGNGTAGKDLFNERSYLGDLPIPTRLLMQSGWVTLYLSSVSDESLDDERTTSTH